MAVTLSRTVRLWPVAGRAPAGRNGLAGVPPPAGWAPFVEIEVSCRGEPDPTTGYLVDIKSIDRAVRAEGVPVVVASIVESAWPGAALPRLLEALGGALSAPVWAVAARLSPFLSYTVEHTMPDTVTVRQSLEFSASHRLHIPGWTEAQNREQFGKCANPNGHGHNYRIEVAVACPAAGPGLDLAALEALVDREVLERFDHKHLNLDTEEFADGSGAIPSVENIARVCHSLLEGPVQTLGNGVRLRSVRVWETDRTSCEYAGPESVGA